jgi:hypothetical protein
LDKILVGLLLGFLLTEGGSDRDVVGFLDKLGLVLGVSVLFVFK